jgi:hypothetical protein
VTGHRRIAWAELPAESVNSLENFLGSRVATATDQPGGFSDGVTTRLTLADGRCVFVKAVNSEQAPHVAAYHRRETAIARRLPAHAPTSRLVDAYDDGVWVALVFENIDGQLPAQPWRRDEFERVLHAATDLAEALTPSPVEDTVLAPPRLGGWQAIAGASTVGRLESLSPWAVGHLDELAALEQQAAPVLAGQTLLHGDLYPFNVMLDRQHEWFVDWPHAWIGASHCDVLTLSSTASLSGIDPQRIADTHPLTRRLDPAQINTFLAVHAGFLIRLAATAEPGADPSLIDTAHCLGVASLQWLNNRLDFRRRA